MAAKSNPEEILAQVIELANELPADPGEYAEIPDRRRKALRRDLESALNQLGVVSSALDPVELPKHIFDPTSPKVIGRIVADTLLLQERESLGNIIRRPFYGAGVYAIYYSGDFASYNPIKGIDHPIYVGKADPAQLQASTPAAQGTRLHTRLKEHGKSILNAANLELKDFDCRFLVVRSAWIKSAEDILIDWFKPIWNNQIKICYGFGKHGDSAATRKNKRSPWDTLHPGRAWATSAENAPGKLGVKEIEELIAAHFAKYLPKGQPWRTL